MVSIHLYWSSSLAVLFLICVGTSDSKPTISRSDGAEAASGTGLRLSSCSQQLEKFKMESRRHVSALQAIADDSVGTAWRKRKLLAVMHPRELKLKPLSSALLKPGAPADAPARVPGKTEPTLSNPLQTYLSSLDHSGWVSKCLKGGKCSVSNPDNAPTETGASGGTTEGPIIVSDLPTKEPANVGNLAIDNISKISNLVNKTLLLSDESPKINAAVSDSVIKANATDSNRIIDLLPAVDEIMDDSGKENSGTNLKESLEHKQNYSSNLNVLVPDQNLKFSGNSDEEFTTQNTGVNEPIEYKTAAEKTQSHEVRDINSESVYFSSSSLDESSPYQTGNYPSFSEARNPFQSNSLRYILSANKLVHYNNHFLPLTIQFTPVNYFQRYPRNEASSDSGVKASGSNVDIQQSRSTDENVRQVGSLNHLVADYGNDLFKRASTGKRDSEFYDLKKEVVTTDYPELPSSHPASIDGHQLFTSPAQSNNSSEPIIFLVLGGNWVNNFKDNPQVFYLQPQPWQPIPSPQAFAGRTVNIDSERSSRQPSPPTRPRCSTSWNTPPKLSVPYSQPSYAVDELKLESHGTRNSGSRASNENKVPSTVAARNDYFWYDYGGMTNDVNSYPTDGPFSGGPVAFPNAGDFGSFTSSETKKGGFKQKADEISYEDSLINFPKPKYTPPPPPLPPVVGAQSATGSKSEDFMEHDINTADMFTVGTQLLAIMPLNPSEHRVDDSNDPAYGKLVADVSARSSPSITSSPPKEPAFSPFANMAFNAPGQVASSSRLRPPNTSNFQSTLTPHIPPTWPNDFEFVSGQWINRKSKTDMSSGGLMYDQIRQRQNREVLMGWPLESPSNYERVPPDPFKPKCFRKSKRSNNPYILSHNSNLVNQQSQPTYLESTATGSGSSSYGKYFAERRH